MFFTLKNVKDLIKINRIYILIYLEIYKNSHMYLLKYVSKYYLHKYISLQYIFWPFLYIFENIIIRLKYI